MLVKVASSAVPKYASIGIIGGGIGGLTVANALMHRENLVDRVSVYEQADQFIPTAGAGFGLSPNGQICLSSIGIDGYHQLYHPFDRMARINAEGTQIKEESNIFRQLREKHGFGIAGCLRADIVALLVQRLEEYSTVQEQPILQYSQKLTRIQPQHDKIELEFESGHQDVVDLVIGADGIHSKVAKSLNIDDNPSIYSGANIFYGKIPQPDRLEYFQNNPIFCDHSVVNGPGTGEFIAFNVGAGGKKTFIWASTYSASSPPDPKQHHQSGQDDEEWNNQSNAQELENSILSRYPQGHPIHDFAKMTVDDDLLHFGLFHRRHKNTWSDSNTGRAVLLGDSCHATLPYAGQGANQAIEDAIVLADCLDRNKDHISAYQEYYDQRFPRTKRIVQFASIMHRLYHSEYWFMHKALDILLKSMLRGGAIFSQLEKEIINECPIKDYRQYAPADNFK
ncbi:hypothetical protein ACHAXR_002650 [Thalassiosira sp. AJA248-18]